MLIIDDHPAMIEGYRSILEFNKNEKKIQITAIHNCADAYNCIAIESKKFDIVFLDMILPPAPEYNIFSGEDLAQLIRKTIPDAKLVILTSHTEAFILYSLIKKSAPDGILVKSDFSGGELLAAFDWIFSGKVYYSITVKQGLKDMLNRNSYLDSYNRQIILLLSKGIKTKNLPQHINLSVSAIDKRKVQIKDYFNIVKGNDEDILREARKCGFI